MGVDRIAAGLAGFGAALALRSAAIVWGLSLPAFKGRNHSDPL